MKSSKLSVVDRLLWDIPIEKRDLFKATFLENPTVAMKNDENLLIKVLSSASWYEIIQLFGPESLYDVLTDDKIERLFPEEKRKYYKNARRLLSEYSLSTAK